jgi:anti-sigma factor ChrR (cupin superfamily)
MQKSAFKPHAHTPAFDDSGLNSLNTRYLNVDELPWMDTPYKGIKIKILLKDESSGLMTALFQWEAGARLPLHEHVNIEQSYVIEGSLSDSEGECKSGHFAWRPAGSQHDAWSKEGCLVLAFLLKPNKFLEGPDAN